MLVLAIILTVVIIMFCGTFFIIGCIEGEVKFLYNIFPIIVVISFWIGAYISPNENKTEFPAVLKSVEINNSKMQYTYWKEDGSVRQRHYPGQRDENLKWVVVKTDKYLWFMWYATEWSLQKRD